MHRKPILQLSWLLLGLGCALLHAQSEPGTVKFDLWQKDRTIGPGFFKASKPVSIDGRIDLPGSNARRAKISVVAGTTLQGSEFFSSFSNWEIDQVRLSDVKLRLGPTNTVTAKGATWSGCMLTFGLRDVEEAPKAGPTPPGPTENSNRVSLQNCELTECKLFQTITPSRTVLEWIGSTFTKMKLPQMVFSSDTRTELATAGTRIAQCRFVGCEVPVSFLLATSNCTFEGCTFTGEAPAQLRERVSVPVAGELPALALPMVVFTNSPAGIGPSAAPGRSLGPASIASAPAPVSSSPPISSSPPMPAVSPASVPLNNKVPPPNMTPDASGVARREARVHGLLIMELASGHEAGQAAVMNAIVLDDPATQQATVGFNQNVGSQMTTALDEVKKHLQVLHGRWPKGVRIELGFADKYSGKDGPSAAVACALLLDSLMTGRPLDPSFAVTGDMNSDGSVQPIGGVRAKIRGATRSQCKIVAIPVKNEAGLGDVLLNEGPDPFASVQIFSITNLEEAQALGYEMKSPAMAKAVSEMDQVQELLRRNKSQMMTWLRDQRVIAKLQVVLAAAPNHLSAKYLLMYGQGRTPTTLTLAGSLDAVDNGGSDAIRAIRARGQGYDALKTQELGGAIGRLTLIRPKLDPRVRPYLDGVLKFANLVKEALDRPPSSYARREELERNIMGAAQSADDALNQLMADPSVVEDLKL